MESIITQRQAGPCALCSVTIRRYGEGASTLCEPCTRKLARMQHPFRAPGEFFEEDEPLEDVQRAYRNGQTQ